MGEFPIIFWEFLRLPATRASASLLSQPSDLDFRIPLLSPLPPRSSHEIFTRLPIFPSPGDPRMGIECSVPGRSQSRDDLLPYPARPWLTNLGEFRGRVTAHDLRPRDFTTGVFSSPPNSQLWTCRLNFVLQSDARPRPGPGFSCSFTLRYKAYDACHSSVAAPPVPPGHGPRSRG